MMKYFQTINNTIFFKILLIKLIQCELNTTIHLVFPSIILQPYQNSPLTEQAIYDLKNDIRKSNEINDFDDDDDDYKEDYEIEIDNQPIKSIELTTSEIKYDILKSSSSRFLSNSIYLLLLLTHANT